MKNTLIITSIVAIVIVSASLGYYLAIALPANNQKQLELSRQKQEEDIKLKKESLKNECLKIKYSSNDDTSFWAGYEKGNLKCE